MMYTLLPLFFLMGSFGGVPVSDSPEEVRAQYEQAAEYLEPGGDLYTIKSIDGQIARIIDQIVQTTEAFGGSPPDSSNVISERIKDYLEEHGVLGAHTVAASTIPRQDGLRDIKLFLGRDTKDRNKSFWRGMAGGEPRPVQHLPTLSENTVLALETSMQFDQLWSFVRDGILRFACNGDEQKLAEILAEAEEETGISLDALFGSMKPNLTLSIHLDPKQTVSLSGNNGFQLQKPGFIVLAGARDNSSLKFLLNLFEEQRTALQPVETSFGTMYQLPEPLDGPLKLQFAALFRDETVYFASSPGLILHQLQAQDGKQLGDRAEFNSQFKALPDRANIFFYCDKRFRTTLNNMRSKMGNSQGGSNREMMMMMQMIMPSELPEKSSGWILRNLPEGLLLEGTGAGDFLRHCTEGGSAINMPMLLGIFSFQRASSTAVRHTSASPDYHSRSSCINNLRQINGAKMQWALEHNKGGDAVPTGADISPYLNQSFADIKCPQGGTYSIRAVDEKPTCSHPKHSLP